MIKPGQDNGVYECICLPTDRWYRTGIYLGMYYPCEFRENDYVRVEIEPNRAWRYYKKQDFFEYFKKVIKDDVLNKKEEYE